MLSEAIEYPLDGDDALERFLLGGVLFLLSPFVVPSILLGGYSVAVVRAVLEGRTEPPGFDDWGALLRDGLSVVAISIVYWLPGLVLAGLGLGVFVITSVVGGDGGAAGAVLVLLSGVGTIVGFAYALVVVYLLPAAIVNFARTGNIGAAWDVETLRTIVTDGTFARAWVGATAVLLVTNSVGGMLMAFLVGFVVFYYGQVAAMYLYARGAMAALDLDPEPPAPPSSPETGGTDQADDGRGSDDTSAGTGPDASDDTDENDSVDRDDGDDSPTAVGAEGEAADDDGGRDLTDVAGVGPATAESLREAGFETVADLRGASREELAAVVGIGPAKADQIKQDVE